MRHTWGPLALEQTVAAASASVFSSCSAYCCVWTASVVDMGPLVLRAKCRSQRVPLSKCVIQREAAECVCCSKGCCTPVQPSKMPEHGKHFGSGSVLLCTPHGPCVKPRCVFGSCDLQITTGATPHVPACQHIICCTCHPEYAQDTQHVHAWAQPSSTGCHYQHSINGQPTSLRVHC